MPTIGDVARIAGVSPMTVSNVLNGRATVTAANRRKVEEAIQSTGYVRNASARALKSGRSQVVGLAVLEAVSPFYGELTAGVEGVLEDEGITVFMASTHNSAEREDSTLRRFAELRSLGVILASTRFTPALHANIARTRASGLAVVAIANAQDDLDACTVGGHDTRGGTLVAEHLSALGRDRFAYVGGPGEAAVYQHRKSGYVDGLRAAGHEVRPEKILDCAQDTIAQGIEAGQRLLDSPTPPSAVFCANDLLALGVLQAATTRRVRVPDDLAVVGYDDIPFAAGAAVPLTSVRQPIREMGEVAAKLLLAEIETGPAHEHTHQVFEPALVARTSTMGAHADRPTA
ncbi:LacI family DNA-binding transcriptional regulator [Occultella aeris]|uniref:Ribose operon repressor n=1 Tax=Occultella aeris TaxID=2761496 RepID=A0A7M4DGW2_9MICO|nr:LacI family DNA-binding transcriptional regulator [Occultella aeris]VZO36155.1 Ribose operon repressor [Occultella aeris]